MDDTAAAPPNSGRFPQTRWSLVHALSGGSECAGAREALEILCRTYWKPLYVFARRQGRSSEDAEDAVQSFFAKGLEQSIFVSADPALGRLRNFLLTSFQHHMQDLAKLARAEKRGGKVQFIPLDIREVEDSLAAPRTNNTPEDDYERTWALGMLDEALGDVEADYSAAGKASVFALLRPFITLAGGGEEQYKHAATTLGLTDSGTRHAVFRLRKQFAAALRHRVSSTLREPSPALVDQELESLRLAIEG